MMEALRRDWPRYVWLALVVAAVLVTLFGVLGWWQARTAGTRVATIAQRLERPAAAPSQSDAPVTTNANAKSPDTPGTLAVKRIDERYLFTPKPPDRFRDIRGVLGDRVLYDGGQSFAVGENAMGATVKAVGSDWVEFEFNGETVKIEMFEGGRGERSSRGSSGGDRRKGRRYGR